MRQYPTICVAIAWVTGLLGTGAHGASYSTDTLRADHTISKYDGSGGMHVGAAGSLCINCDWDNNNSPGRFINFGTNGSFSPTNLMRIKDDGTVGIGTTSPTERLQVAGGIKADSIIISSWKLKVPDYVFDSAQALRPLEEVELFVKEHGHLPEVPSASEMEDRGINIAELNLILLKKVEELTLYVIQQRAQLAEQQRAMAEMRIHRPVDGVDTAR